MIKWRGADRSTEGEVLAVSETDKGLTSGTHHLLQIREKRVTPTEQWAKDANLQFSEWFTLKANKHDQVLKISVNHQRDRNLM